MDIDFGSNRLERAYRNSQEAVQQWGEPLARKYIQRIDQIRAAPDLTTLRKISSARVHPLKGDRTGEYALDLQGRWRLIVLIHDKLVTIKEVSNHYGD